ncbi:ATP-dependent RNA helicase DbpA [Pseudomaricurvus hydrocarbonicus]|uniref:ATP-dependent RNA helicase DbpA n=1 Tax=Pseudomaricurvus hydrocarbonicus TaxID=1470433 RepID=UPI003C7B4863
MLQNPSFSQLTLPADLYENLKSLDYHTMTPVQAQSLPLLLEGKDVIAQAKTGSGKTVAFGLGVLARLDVKKFRVQALVLCPTRELADQVAREVRKLARGVHNVKVLTLCGGMPFGPQIGSLEHGAHIVVGTPGRIEEHLRKERLSLEHVHTLVLDEADRMLDMGFQASLDAIIAPIPRQRQTLLFSATFPEQIEKIANNIMQRPERVTVESPQEESTITQYFYPINDENHRRQAVGLLLKQDKATSAIVFCNTKRECQEVATELASQGFSALALHGDLEQRDRDQVLVRFANKSVSVLVATDVAARGLDIQELDTVINYQISRDPEVHVHRVGRTGRAGSHGRAHTLYSDKETFKLRLLEDEQGVAVEREILPPASIMDERPQRPPMVTLQIDGGKKSKVRPGDILGALTGDDGVQGSDVGKIQVYPMWSYVAVKREVAKIALTKLGAGKLKGRNFRVRQLR